MAESPTSSILVVDDQAVILDICRRTLAEAGYSVVTAGNGIEALAAIGQRDFRLVIADVFMPEMEGLELLRELRKRFPDLKVIAMSGGGSAGTGALTILEVAQKLGADDVLAKPFSSEDLLVAVEELLANVATDGRSGETADPSGGV